jgi:hypothetical protein
MLDFTLLVAQIVSSIRDLFALGNLNGLSASERAETLKVLTGLLAGLGTAPHAAGLGFIEGKLAQVPGRLLPGGSPASLAAGLTRWQLEQAIRISEALQGDAAAAEQAVEGVSRLGRTMAGRER